MSEPRVRSDRGDGRFLVRATDVLSRTGAFGVVVLGCRSPKPITLSGSGVEIWEMFETPRSVADLVGILAREYQVDASVVAADVEPVIDHLVEQGILRETA